MKLNIFILYRLECKFLIGVLLFFLSSINLFAQLVSPGELSNVHSKLAGVQNCTKCHNFGDKTFREQCLACHTEIKSRIDAKAGYHNTTRNIQCSECHKEHHGHDFKLIRWDPNKFDHKQAGFALDGKHSDLECKKCHNPNNIKMKDVAGKSNEYKSRTYLGLMSECGSCHKDIHRGQLSNNCGTCHTSTGWKPVPNFSHTKAKFKLAGKHAEVACAKCHPSKTDGKSVYNEKSYIQFTGLKFGQCIDCHKDHHNGTFGEKCDKCHNPSSWKSVQMSKDNFNHAVTKYPLQGKHITVHCEKCHTGGSYTEFKNKDTHKCLTCHEDFHKGQFASRTDKGECASCHTVQGFTPTLYELKDHKNARYQLTGAHRAIPCGKCHAETNVKGKKIICFQWERFQCTECHKDEHAGQFADKIAAGGCESCHSVNSWKELKFDHARTRFKLEGKHLNTTCEKCHKSELINTFQTIRYKIEKLECESCHEDYHHGQLEDPATHVTSCKKCHNASGWKSIIFDHNSQSRFKLSGKHAAIQCIACHKNEPAPNGKMSMRFKPLDVACSSCHKDMKQ